MSFWEPTKYFDWLLDIEDKYVSDEEWNRASQDERERMLQPVIDEYMNQHGSETDWDEFFDDLEDNNCHTEFRLFHERLAKRGSKHAKRVKRAMLDTVAFTNHFAVDVEVNVDVSQYIDEYPEDFGCNSGDEVLEKIEEGDLDDDEIINIIGSNLYRFVYTETYINDSVGVESEFEITDISANDFYDDWEEV